MPVNEEIDGDEIVSVQSVHMQYHSVDRNKNVRQTFTRALTWTAFDMNSQLAVTREQGWDKR